MQNINIRGGRFDVAQSSAPHDRGGGTNSPHWLAGIR
jgi:hypothetical protein